MSIVTGIPEKDFVDEGIAISSLKPGAEFCYNPGEGITAWHSSSITQPTQSEIDAEVVRLKALWDDEKLMQELREISDIDDMQQYFNDLDLNKMISENLEVKPIEVSDENLGKTLEEQQDNFVNTQEENLHRVMCPHCLKEHYVNREELNNFKPDWQTKLAEE